MIVNSVQPLIPIILGYETLDREVTVQMQSTAAAAAAAAAAPAPGLPPAPAPGAVPLILVPPAPAAAAAPAPPPSPPLHTQPIQVVGQFVTNAVGTTQPIQMQAVSQPTSDAKSTSAASKHKASRHGNRDARELHRVCSLTVACSNRRNDAARKIS